MELLNRPGRFGAFALLLTACTPLRPSSDTLPADGSAMDGSMDASGDASDGSNLLPDASGCVGPTITGVDFPVIAHHARLRITGGCFTGATAVTLGGTSQTFTPPTSDTEIVVPSIDDTTPVGTTQSLVITRNGVSSGVYPLTVVHLVVNEADSVTGSGNKNQFVEIGTGLTGTSVDLSGYYVVFADGSKTYTGTSGFLLGPTASSGFYLRSGATASFAGAAQGTFTSGLLGQGTAANAILLFQGSTRTPTLPAGNVGIGTLTDLLVDALVYSETNVANDTTLLGFAYPNAADQVQWSEATNGTASTESVERCGTALRSGNAYRLGTPTPGAANMPCP